MSFALKFKSFSGFIIFLFTLLVILSSTTAKNERDLEYSNSENIVANETNFSEEKKDVAKFEELEISLKAYFEQAIASGQIVGAGVSIVKEGNIIISEGYGRRISTENDRVDGETVFRLGSLSKGFAGVLAATLEHEKKLKWNDRVVDYLPEFKLGDSINTNNITLSHILSHTTGAPYHSFTNLVEADLPLRKIAARFNEVSPISEPGSQYSYQNALFALSGEIVKQAISQDLATSLQNRFFQPLGMCSTFTDYKTLSERENIALPHSKRKNGWRTLKLSDNYFNAIAAGGINANAHDMGKWMRFLLGHNPEVFQQSAFIKAFEPFIEIPGRIKYYHKWPGHTKSSYGFGWRIHEYIDETTGTEKTMWHHGGSVNSYRNEIALYPEDDLGICVLLNSNSRLARNVIPDLHEIINDIYGHPSEKIAQYIPTNNAYPAKG